MEVGREEGFVSSADLPRREWLLSPAPLTITLSAALSVDGRRRAELARCHGLSFRAPGGRGPGLTGGPAPQGLSTLAGKGIKGRAASAGDSECGGRTGVWEVHRKASVWGGLRADLLLVWPAARYPGLPGGVGFQEFQF